MRRRYPHWPNRNKPNKGSTRSLADAAADIESPSGRENNFQTGSRVRSQRLFMSTGQPTPAFALTGKLFHQEPLSSEWSDHDIHMVPRFNQLALI
jgi:hypothetical protein